MPIKWTFIEYSYFKLTMKFDYLIIPAILVSCCISITIVSGSGTIFAEIHPFVIVVGRIVSDCNSFHEWEILSCMYLFTIIRIFMSVYYVMEVMIKIYEYIYIKIYEHISWIRSWERALCASLKFFKNSVWVVMINHERL